MDRTKTVDKPTSVNGAANAPSAATLEAATNPGTATVAAPPKLRRRPLLFLAGVALVIVGALLAVWIWSSNSESTEVVAVRDTVMRGETIAADDLISVQLTPDPALQVVPASRAQEFVGMRAARDMTTGSLLTQEAVTDEVTPAAGQSVVGLALTPSLMPGETLVVGDAVRVVATAGGQGDPTSVTQDFAYDAEVTDVLPTTATGQTVVSVTVPDSEAAELAKWAASGRVALVLQSREN